MDTADDNHRIAFLEFLLRKSGAQNRPVGPLQGNDQQVPFGHLLELADGRTSPNPTPKRVMTTM
ncbi:MAG: hypothetical protein JWL90_649 [Chthoniobacteraceae bacterium]|nr:hypothetical protein [Chthoniobacteraceae bacterium]